MDTENHEPTHTGADPNQIPAPPAVPGREGSAGRRRRFNSRIWLGPGMVVVLLVAIYFWKHGTRAAARPVTATEAVTVAVAKVRREDLFTELTRPAEFRPYVEVELHAKVSGYLDQMNVDFGDKVKSHQLLATIEVPELLDELHNASATEQKAEADYTNAELAYTRLVAVNRDHPNLVAEQDLDTAQAKDLAAAAAVAGAKADVEKYRTLEAYTQITAPFDGVVTKRYADPGALIQAGTASDTQSMPLVRISDNYRLRLDIPVPVDYVEDIHVGDPVRVRVDSLGGRTFEGKLSRFTDRVDDETRTMIAEIEVANEKLELMPGMYATVFLKVGNRPNALAVPSQAVNGGKEPTVYVVNHQHEIEVRPVTLGLETPDEHEILSGLEEGDLVMIGNRSLVQPGQKVQIKMIAQLSAR